MSNRIEHILIGSVIGIGAYMLIKHTRNEKVELKDALGYGLIGGGIAVLPDFLEPPTNPNHRKFAHSIIAGASTLYLTKKAWEVSEISSEQKIGISCLAASYLSHLALDSTTPKGLPIF